MIPVPDFALVCDWNGALYEEAPLSEVCIVLGKIHQARRPFLKSSHRPAEHLREYLSFVYVRRLTRNYQKD